MSAKKPIALARLEGNPGKRRLPTVDEEVRVGPGAPELPNWLDAEAKAEWRRVVPELTAVGLLGKVDRAALSGYCQAWARWKEAEAILSAKGLTSKIKSGYIMQRPEVAVALKYLAMVKAFCSEFGLTPSSRARMSVPGRKSPSAMAALLGKN